MLRKRRAITKGPGGKGWSDSTTVTNQPARLLIRGLFSECECSRKQECRDCRGGEAAYLHILGVFNADLNQRAFIFWGFLASRRDALIDHTRDTDPSADGCVHTQPEHAQLVCGWYTPYPERNVRGWIAPYPENFPLRTLFITLYNTADPIEDSDVGIPQLGRLLPHSALLRMMQERTNLQLRLRHTHDDVVGDAEISIMSIEATHGGHGALRFNVALLHKREGQDPRPDSHPEALLVVRADGTWNSITARRDGETHRFELAS